MPRATVVADGAAREGPARRGHRLEPAAFLSLNPLEAPQPCTDRGEALASFIRRPTSKRVARRSLRC